jgi:outer membrane cobalamin receptor
MSKPTAAVTLLILSALLSTVRAAMIDTLLIPDSAVVRFKEVVTVASRAVGPPGNTSQRSTRIPADKIRQVTANDLALLFEDEPGLNVRSYGGLKGVSSLSLWGASTQQMLITVDGHPVVNPFSGTADLGLLSLNDLRGVEVARGAGSSLYGANALGGAVNLVTGFPRPFMPGTLYQALGVDASLPLTAGFNYQTGFGDMYQGALFGIEQDGAEGFRSNSRSQTYRVTGNLGGIASPRLPLTATLSGALTSRNLGVPGPEPDSAAIPTWGDSTASSLYDREQDLTATVRGDLGWRPGVRGVDLWLALKPDYTYTRTIFNMLSPWALSPDDQKRDVYQSWAAANTLTASLTRSELLRAAVGYDLRFERGNVASEMNDTNWQARAANHALWGEAHLRLPFGLSPDASLRLDANQDYGLALNPTLGVAYAPLSGLKLRANWGTGFRAPTFSDRYWPLSGVKDIRPEKGMTAQAGVDFRVHGRGVENMFSVTGFWRRTQDLIVWLPDSYGLWRPVNVDSAEHKGVEFSCLVLPVQGFEVRANATWLDGTQKRRELTYYNFLTGETRFETVERKAAFVPALSLGAELAYRLPFGTRLSVSGRYRSERVNYYQSYNSDFSVTCDAKRLAGFMVLDAGVSHMFLHRLQVVLRAQNLLDVRYAEQFGNSIQDRDYPMPGRNVSLGVRYEGQ